MSDYTHSPTPILPGDTDEDNRRQHTRDRLKLLTGSWEELLTEHRAKHFKDVRNTHIGPSDLSTNFLLAMVSELSKLYEGEVDAKHDMDSAEIVKRYIQQVRESGWWQLAQTNQRRVLCMNENIVRPSWVPSIQGYMQRLVSPSNVYAEANADTPDTPSMVIEARERVFRNELRWTWDYSNANTKEFRILLPGKKKTVADAEDITADVLAESTDGEFTELTGDAYPWIGKDGNARVPYVIYHSERTAWLFDTYRGMEIVDGTLTSAVLWTFWTHVVRDASWPQRYVAGAKLRGASVTGSDTTAARSVETDPASILQFKADGDGTPQIGQWKPGADPKLLSEALMSWEQRLAVYYHMGSDDFQRSGDAESGYAISIKRQSVREACSHYTPQFSRADGQLLELMAIMQNRAEGTSIPEDGYRVGYPSLPKSIEERKAESEEIDARIARGTASDVDAYILENPGTSRADALKNLMEIDTEKAKRQQWQRRLNAQLGAGMEPTDTMGGDNDVR